MTWRSSVIAKGWSFSVIFKKYPYKIAKNTPNHCEINVKGSKRRKEEQAPQPTFPREKVGWGACSSYSFEVAVLLEGEK